MSLDSAQLTATMMRAALDALTHRTPAVRAHAEREFAKLARSFVVLQGELAAGTISHEEAMLEVQAERENAHAVLSTVDGMGQLASEKALAAGLRAVRDEVNGAVGFELV